MKDVIIKHKTSDGKTNHEVNLTDKKHTVVTEDNTAVDGFVSVNKRWGTQQKLVEKMISNEIELVNEKMLVQKKTINECIYYNSTSNLEPTRKALEKNEEKLNYLKEYVYETKD
jgi:hypothetical protein